MTEEQKMALMAGIYAIKNHIKRTGSSSYMVFEEDGEDVKEIDYRRAIEVLEGMVNG